MGESGHAASPGTVTVAVDVAMTEVMRAVAMSTALDASTMTAIVQAVRLCVSAAEHVALTLVVKPRGFRPELEFGAASGHTAATVLRAELAAEAGPSFAAVIGRAAVARWDEVEFEGRWVGVRDTAAMAGARSVLAVPILDAAHGYSVAVLTMMSSQTKPFAAHSVIQAETVAALFSVALTASRSQNQFQVALQSRDLIGQAKGMIMERFRIGADNAFRLLAKLSQDSNVPLVTVAANLVAAEHLGGGDAPPSMGAQPTG